MNWFDIPENNKLGAQPGYQNPKGTFSKTTSQILLLIWKRVETGTVNFAIGANGEVVLHFSIHSSYSHNVHKIMLSK